MDYTMIFTLFSLLIFTVIFEYFDKTFRIVYLSSMLGIGKESIITL